MKLENFRQFFGEQELSFESDSPDKNVTVIHGFNGSGKTALLNAFVWCMYGKTTHDFQEETKLENEKAVAAAEVDDSVVVAVELWFEMKGRSYRVRRERISKKGAGGQLTSPKDELLLWKIDQSGETAPVGRNPLVRQTRLEQFLPSGLYPFFFFNGERVENLASPDAYDRVEAGVKTLLDVEVYERGARHLRDSVTRDLTSSLRAFGDRDLDDVTARFEELETEVTRLEDREREKKEEIRLLDEEIDSYEQEKDRVEAIAELVTRERGLEREFGELSGRISEARKRQARALSRHGYLAFAGPTLAVTQEQVDRARKKGEIPAKIKPQFVRDLIGDGVCICGREIIASSPEYDALLAWDRHEGVAELEESINLVANQLPSLRSRRNQALESIMDEASHIDELRHHRKLVEEDLSAVKEKLGDPEEVAEAAVLQDKIEKLRSQGKGLNRELGAVKGDLGRAVAERDRALEQVTELQQKNEKVELVQQQIRSVGRVAVAFERIAELQQNDVRRSLNLKIKEIWQDAAVKDYEASVSEDYRLVLTKRLGVSGTTQPVVGASTGEKQVLALSFVASLVDKARENLERALPEGLGEMEGGAQYPLVMDSPFGSLEDEYRDRVAHWIPSLADQVVVLVSNTQWRGEVEQAMRPKVANEYILELHTRKEGVDRLIEIEGSSYPYVVSSSEPFERTQIEKVANG